MSSAIDSPRWQPYPAYKLTGVEWLGDIPAHWEAKRLKHLCTRSALYGVNESAASYSSEGVRFLRTTDITDDGELTTDSAVFLERSLVDEYLLQDGDLLISRSGTLGRSFVYDSKSHGECSYAGYLVRYVPAQSLMPRFAFYFTKTSHFQQWLSLVVISSTIGNINGQKYANMHLPVPPVHEQRAIAVFLDRETTRLDALMARKQRLIELLQEQRTALISQAVTKGLDPNVAMKDSGVEWLGEIPTEWKVTKLKHLSQIKYGLGQPPKEIDGGLPLLRATNVERGKINPSGLVYIDPNDVPYDRDPVLKTDDIIVVRSGAYTGDSAIIPPEYDGAITGYDMVVRARAAKPKYIAYSLLSIPVLRNQIDLCRLRAAQPHINAEELGACLFFIPPEAIQEQIIEHLDAQLSKIDRLIAKINDAIERLREYRTALIAAAVTGKIDVRNT